MQLTSPQPSDNVPSQYESLIVLHDRKTKVNKLSILEIWLRTPKQMVGKKVKETSPPTILNN